MKKTRLFWLLTCLMLVLTLTSCSKPTYELEEYGEEITYEEFMEAYESFEGYVDEDFSILDLDIDIMLTYMISIGFVDENNEIQPKSDIYYEYQIDSDKGNILLTGKTYTASSDTEETYNYQIQKNKDDNSEEYPYIYINLDDKTYEYKTKDEIEALFDASYGSIFELSEEGKYYSNESLFKKTYTVTSETDVLLAKTNNIIQLQASLNKIIVKVQSTVESLFINSINTKAFVEVKMKNVRIKDIDLSEYQIQ